jgi:hypothetical protein
LFDEFKITCLWDEPFISCRKVAFVVIEADTDKIPPLIPRLSDGVTSKDAQSACICLEFFIKIVFCAKVSNHM